MIFATNIQMAQKQGQKYMFVHFFCVYVKYNRGKRENKLINW